MGGCGVDGVLSLRVLPPVGGFEFPGLPGLVGFSGVPGLVGFSGVLGLVGFSGVVGSLGLFGLSPSGVWVLVMVNILVSSS